MTTTVKIEAHCDPEKTEVQIQVDEGDVGGTTVIQNGETHETYAYDNRVITVREVEKKSDAA